MLALASCGPSSHPREPHVGAVSTTGAQTATPDARGASTLTVLVFYAAECPCFRAHDARIRELARDYGARGVRLFLVDSEVGATAERDDAEARSRGLPRVLIDARGELAKRFGATRATYSVIVDASGRALYRGGFDSDKARLTEKPDAYVREALDELLAGRQPRRPDAPTQGCALDTP